MKSFTEENILICIPTIKALMDVCEQVHLDDSFEYLTKDKVVHNDLTGKGFKKIWLLEEGQKHIQFDRHVHKVIILEDNLAETCTLAEVIKTNIIAPLIVVTKNKKYPKILYECLGARHVVYTNCNDITFLIH